MIRLHCDFVIFLLLIFSSRLMGQSSHNLHLPNDLHGAVKLNISTLPNLEAESLAYEELAVFVKNEKGEYITNAIQGDYKREGNYLLFKPYFPFESGMTYVVRTKDTRIDGPYSFQSFEIGKKKKLEEAKIISIYPSAHQLPENLLRFYIYFNTPMKKGQVLKHIQLIDAEGNIDRHAFMEFKQELWSADGKRLTILFDPGRIKKGVSTNILRGPALLDKKHYKLSISGTWEDVYGQPLSIHTTKEIEVVGAYRQHIKVGDWSVDKPKTNSHHPLTLHFDRIIDHALLQSMITVENKGKRPIAGHWEISEKEQQIQFIPEHKWQKGNYRIVVDSRLEDIAGNNLQNLLDHHKIDKMTNSHSHQFIDFRL